ALQGEEPRYRRTQVVVNPVMDPVAPIIEGWLRADRKAPKNQRHSARRVYLRLVEEYGFTGAESTVRAWIRRWRARNGEGDRHAVVPLDPEVAREAEVDWGTASVVIDGELRKVKLFVM